MKTKRKIVRKTRRNKKRKLDNFMVNEFNHKIKKSGQNPLLLPINP